MILDKIPVLSLIPVGMAVFVAKTGRSGWWVIAVGIVGAVCVFIMSILCNWEDEKLEKKGTAGT